MMARLGLVTRVAVIILAILLALQFLLAGLYILQRNDVTDSSFRLPLPDQMAAIITLLDTATPAQRNDLLRALNGTELQVDIVPAKPAGKTMERAMPAIAAAIHEYLPQGSGIRTEVWLNAGSSGFLQHFPRLQRMLDRHMRVIAELQDGRVAVIDTGGSLATRILGLPTGFFAGMFGFLVAGLAVFVVAREMRPLAGLARAVTSFAAGASPQNLPEKGAREVRLLIRAVNHMQTSIASLLRGRSFMLGALSHDLRTYLTRLRLRFEMIPDPAMRARAGRDIEDMQTLIEDALTFARASFMGDDASAVTNLTGIVRRVTEEKAASGARVHIVTPATPVIVGGGALALARVVANLIDNAVKYGDEAAVSLRQEKHVAVLLVEDRGPGIPAADRDRIFEPFHRLEESRNREQGGAGLGLAIARQIVDGLGGCIGITDRPGGGSSFWIRLPLRG